MSRLLPLALLLALTACSDDQDGATLTVFAASSLTTTFTTLGEQFEKDHPGTDVVFSFAGSSALAAQIRQAAPADVFASASSQAMATVEAEISSVDAFATNSGEIVVAPDSDIDELRDLADPRTKVALCASDVPCGALADTVLRNARLTVKPVTRGLDVRATLAYVTHGSADAAIVYVTDVLAAGSKVKGVPIPAAQNATTAYAIATVKATKHAELAQAFRELVLSDAGQSVLAAAGFAAP